MQPCRRNELIEEAAYRQFKIDHPHRLWLPFDMPGAQINFDERALYLFNAERQLISHGVIPPPRRQAA